MKLARRGHYMPEALLANAHLVHHIGELVMENPRILGADVALEQLAAGDREAAHLVVVDGARVVAVLPRGWPTGGARTLGEVRGPPFVVVPRQTTLFELMAVMQRAHATVAAVTEDGEGSAPRIRGIVSTADLAEAYAEGMELFED